MPMAIDVTKRVVHLRQSAPMVPQPRNGITHSNVFIPTLQDFERSISGLAPKTRAIYLRAAKRAVSDCLHVADDSTSEAVLRLLEGMQWTEKRERFGRVHRFERFLRTVLRGTNVQMNIPANLHLLKQMQYKPITNMSAVRDFALLAAWATIGQGRGVLELAISEVTDNPSALFIRGQIAPPPYRGMLRRWLKIRLRANRPEQYRILRRTKAWADSPLLFPGSNGQPLSRSAIYNALRRLQAAAGSPSSEVAPPSG
jgi:hypothetical protein